MTTTLSAARRQAGLVLILLWVLALVLVAVHAFGVAQRATVSNLPDRVQQQSQYLPPYWRVQAPSWCNEDQVCWIGSAADGRPANEALADWNEQLGRLATMQP